MKRHRKILVAAGLAIAALTGATVGAGAASAATSAATYPTAIANVHLRSMPSDVKPSKVVMTIATAGTNVTITCYVTTTVAGVSHTWYRSTLPAAGYVAGRNLVIPHHKTTLPAC